LKRSEKEDLAFRIILITNQNVGSRRDGTEQDAQRREGVEAEQDEKTDGCARTSSTGVGRRRRNRDPTTPHRDPMASSGALPGAKGDGPVSIDDRTSARGDRRACNSGLTAQTCDPTTQKCDPVAENCDPMASKSDPMGKNLDPMRPDRTFYSPDRSFS